MHLSSFTCGRGLCSESRSADTLGTLVEKKTLTPTLSQKERELRSSRFNHDDDDAP